jgi:hypothetical protein
MTDIQALEDRVIRHYLNGHANDAYLRENDAALRNMLGAKFDASQRARTYRARFGTRTRIAIAVLAGLSVVFVALYVIKSGINKIRSTGQTGLVRITIVCTIALCVAPVVLAALWRQHVMGEGSVPSMGDSILRIYAALVPKRSAENVDQTDYRAFLQKIIDI